MITQREMNALGKDLVPLLNQHFPGLDFTQKDGNARWQAQMQLNPNGWTFVLRIQELPR